MKRINYALWAAVFAIVLAATTVVAGAATTTAANAQIASYPREQTLHTAGTQWGEIQGFNPYNAGQYATGTIGLAYETLFRYDPLKDVYMPWLADGGRWTAPNRYELSVRNGVTWSDGSPLTAEQVRWNLDLGRFASAPWHSLDEQLAADGISVSGNSVRLTFAERPRYAEWTTLLCNLPIVSPSQWASVDNDTLLTFNPLPPLGTGPYVLDEAGYDPATQVAWRKSPVSWWATSAGFEPSPGPLYIVDHVNTGDELNGLLTGALDLSNNYVPPSALEDNPSLHSYYDGAPYFLSANTVWLLPNTTRTPLDDPAFRRALADAIDIDAIVADVYSGGVVKADPTGLLPNLSKYISDKGSAVARLGFSYDIAAAKSVLARAGYVDTDGDGYVENRDGTEIDLSLNVPMGWLDWEQAMQVIADSAEDAGIRITPSPIDYYAYVDARSNGGFDLLLDNSSMLSDTPWTTFDYLYRQPVGEAQAVNFERFSGQAADRAWSFTQMLDTAMPASEQQRKAFAQQVERITLEQLPAIALWYNGVWSGYSDQYWKNWPTSTGNEYLPAMWRSYFQTTGIDMIAHLEPAS